MISPGFLHAPHIDRSSRLLLQRFAIKLILVSFVDVCTGSRAGDRWTPRHVLAVDSVL